MKRRVFHSGNYFDRQFNLMYIPTQDLSKEEEDSGGSFWGKKSKSIGSKSSSTSRVNNILIHDIPKDMEFSYFQEEDLEEEEYIRSFMFEQYYDYSRRGFQLSGYGAYEVANNFDLSERSPQNRLLVETYQPEPKIRRLWLGDKWGIDKFPFMELGEQEKWHYDVYNLSIRIIGQEDNQLTFKSLDF